ncbi:unnamed protein product [Allacma fusca]|uniref:Uncharacterized protein n=1 Tax=Allacma fusca TaxID=39272 RepID=A0A8J2Q125_9HEXA|nr:unnamed protein product [Allacma fusca]
MADNFGTCYGCNGPFLCFEEVARIDKPACPLHSMHPTYLNLEVAVGEEIFALCPGVAMGNRAWFKLIAGQIAFPSPSEAPPLVPRDDGGFDPHGMALLRWEKLLLAERAYSEEQPRVCGTPPKAIPVYCVRKQPKKANAVRHMPRVHQLVNELPREEFGAQ